MARLCVHLLHSTDEPEKAVLALSTALAALSSEREGLRPVLHLAGEGSRLAVHGVGSTLAGAGRPDAAAMLREFTERGGRLLVSGPCLASRGFAKDALLPGVEVVDHDALARLAGDGYAVASF